MKMRWWTCRCGKRQTYCGMGTPVCESCGKPAPFTPEAPKGQGGFDFGNTEEKDK